MIFTMVVLSLLALSGWTMFVISMTTSAKHFRKAMDGWQATLDTCDDHLRKWADSDAEWSALVKDLLAYVNSDEFSQVSSMIAPEESTSGDEL